MIGQTLGHYRIERRLGKGGTSVMHTFEAMGEHEKAKRERFVAALNRATERHRAAVATYGGRFPATSSTESGTPS